jgi:TRAP-type C4-dicarboxylate transport system substrate-binding protein
MGLITSNNLVSFSPSMAVFSLPYMFKDTGELRAAVNGMWDDINKRVAKEAGLLIIGYSEKGFRVIANSKRPIKTLPDLKGLRVRVPKNPMQFDVFRAWGGNPIPIAWGELFPALQQGVVDGIENVYISILSERFFEVVKYATDVHYFLFSSEMVIQEQKFKGLAPSLQQAIVRAGREATEVGFTSTAAEVERAKKTLIEKHGMVLSGPPTDEAKWEQIARGLWPQFYKLIGGGDSTDGERLVERFDKAKGAR